MKDVSITQLTQSALFRAAVLLAMSSPFLFYGAVSASSNDGLCSLKQASKFKYELSVGGQKTLLDALGKDVAITKCEPLATSSNFYIIEWQSGTVGTTDTVNKIEVLVFSKTSQSDAPIFRSPIGEIASVHGDKIKKVTIRRDYSFIEKDSQLFLQWNDGKGLLFVSDLP